MTGPLVALIDSGDGRMKHRPVVGLDGTTGVPVVQDDAGLRAPADTLGPWTVCVGERMCDGQLEGDPAALLGWQGR